MFETAKGDTLSCPNCNTESDSHFKVTRLQSGTLVFRCAECGETLEHTPDVTVDTVIKFAGEHLGPSALGIISALFGRSKANE